MVLNLKLGKLETKYQNVIGKYPVKVYCGFCKKEVLTSIQKTWGSCALWTCYCCWCLVLLDCAKDVSHHCSECMTLLGIQPA